MKVAIYGAGAMGTVLGAYITKAGFEIDLINRNKLHVKGLKEQGAQIIGKTHFTIPVKAYLPEEMEDYYDIILLMTKQRHNKEIVQFLKPHLSDKGIICTMQNGIPEPLVAEIIGKDKTVGCTMSWGASFIGEGKAELTSDATRETLTFSIGKYGNVNHTIFDYIVKLLNTMGDVKVEENFIGARWSKLLINAAFSGLSVVLDATFGEISKNRTSRKIALGIIKECIDVAHAAGITIEPLQGHDVKKLMDYNSWIKKQLSLFILPIAMKKHKNIRSSMLRDLAKARKTEIDAINGIVCAYGDKYGINTVLNDQIVTIVHQIEVNELKSSWENITLIK
jgi:2-dehydropantoate 2-reductase